MKKIINLKESLLSMDKDTDCRYDLTNLYEACNLDDKKKRDLAKYITAYDIEGTNKFLSNEASSMGLMENTTDDLSDEEFEAQVTEGFIHMTDETTCNPLVMGANLKAGDLVYDEKTGNQLKVLSVEPNSNWSRNIQFINTTTNEPFVDIVGNNSFWEVVVEGDTAYEVDDDIDIEFHPIDELTSQLNAIDDEPIEEAIPAVAMALGTAAATGLGQAVGDNLCNRILGEDLDTASIEQEVKDAMYSILEPTYDIDFVNDYCSVSVEDTEDNVIVHVSAELGFNALSNLGNKLNKIVTKYDPKTYFEAETSGRLVCYIRKDQSDDIVDEEAVKEWTAKFNACKTRDELISVYKELVDLCDNGGVTYGTIEVLFDVIDAKSDELDSLGESLTEDFSSITALADDCGKNTFKTSNRDIRFTFNDETSASKFMDELRDRNIHFDELPRGIIKVNKSVALDESLTEDNDKVVPGTLYKVCIEGKDEFLLTTEFDDIQKYINDQNIGDFKATIFTLSNFKFNNTPYLEYNGATYTNLIYPDVSAKTVIYKDGKCLTNLDTTEFETPSKSKVEDYVVRLDNDIQQVSNDSVIVSPVKELFKYGVKVDSVIHLFDTESDALDYVNEYPKTRTLVTLNEDSDQPEKYIKLDLQEPEYDHFTIGGKEVPYKSHEEAKAHLDDFNLKDYEEELYKYLKSKDMYPELYVNPDNTLSVHIEWGDWKHDHQYIDSLINNFFFNRGLILDHDMEVTEDDGSDTYSATHYYTVSDVIFSMSMKKDNTLGESVEHNRKYIITEGAFDDIKNVAKSVGNSIKNNRTFKRNVQPTIDNVKDKVNNSKVVNKVKDTADKVANSEVAQTVKNTDTAKGVKGSINSNKFMSAIRKAQTQDELNTIVKQIQDAQKSGQLDANNRINHLLKTNIKAQQSKLKSQGNGNILNMDESLNEDFYDDDFTDEEMAGLLGGELMYCPDCGSGRYYDGHCYACGDPEEINESTESSWTDAYQQFSTIVDTYFPDETKINDEVEKLYNQHKGDPIWDEAYSRWCSPGYDESLNEELWNSSRVSDLVTYYLDQSNVPINTLAQMIMKQMKEEGSKLPFNITDFYDTLYMAVDRHNSDDDLNEGWVTSLSDATKDLSPMDKDGFYKVMDNITCDPSKCPLDQLENEVGEIAARYTDGNASPDYEGEDFYNDEYSGSKIYNAILRLYGRDTEISESLNEDYSYNSDYDERIKYLLQDIESKGKMKEFVELLIDPEDDENFINDEGYIEYDIGGSTLYINSKDITDVYSVDDDPQEAMEYLMDDSSIVRFLYDLDLLYEDEDEDEDEDAFDDGEDDDKPTSITIPEGTKNIRKGAFKMHRNLISVKIPNSVTSIGKEAFYYCTDLKSINIPDSVTSIGEAAFYFCQNIQSITIPHNVTSIEDHTFSDCTRLTSITIPNSVTSIGDSAFMRTGVTSVVIPHNVTKIDDYAFAFCDKLTSVTIPDSVTSIGDNAFWYCDKLTITTTKGSYAEQYAKDNDISVKYVGE